MINVNKTNKLDNLNADFKKIFLKPLKFSPLILVIFVTFFSFLLLFIIFNFVLLLNFNRSLQQDFSVFENNTNKKIKGVSDTINIVKSTSLSGGVFNSFGDTFSGLAYIDQTKTNMNWDGNSAAFTFPPLYNFTKTQKLFDNLKVDLALLVTVLNKDLYYKNKKINLPPELKSENILSLNVSLVGTHWLVGAITGKTYDETVWVYFFDPQTKSFSPLITKNTSEKIELKYQKIGGEIAFGGSDDNFLIVYGGYDGRALYYYKGLINDVSSLFSLRVSAEGFNPQIISRDNSRGTVFYICSQTAGKPKLVKLWPKREGELMGSLDFSPLIFTGDLSSTVASCQLAGSDILINIKKADNALETWRFVDNGFDNSLDREVVSFDLGRGRGDLITSAVVQELHMSTDGIKQNGEVSSSAELFLANSENDWQKIKPYIWKKFVNPTESLFWRATFKAEPGYPDYSPWFDDIMQLNYQTL